MQCAGEVRYLGKIFSKIPTMGVFIDTLNDRYCMAETSFTELEYRARLGDLLAHTPNASAVRLNLPFQLISRHCHAATMILGNTIEALAERARLQLQQEQEQEGKRDGEEEGEAAPLRTLVIENLTDTTVVKLVSTKNKLMSCLSRSIIEPSKRHGEELGTDLFLPKSGIIRATFATSWTCSRGWSTSCCRCGGTRRGRRTR